MWRYAASVVILSMGVHVSGAVADIPQTESWIIIRLVQVTESDGLAPERPIATKQGEIISVLVEPVSDESKSLSGNIASCGIAS